MFPCLLLIVAADKTRRFISGQQARPQIRLRDSYRTFIPFIYPDFGVETGEAESLNITPPAPSGPCWISHLQAAVYAPGGARKFFSYKTSSLLVFAFLSLFPQAVFQLPSPFHTNLNHSISLRKVLQSGHYLYLQPPIFDSPPLPLAWPAVLSLPTKNTASPYRARSPSQRRLSWNFAAPDGLLASVTLRALGLFGTLGKTDE